MASIDDIAELILPEPDLAAQFTQHFTSWLNETYPSLQEPREPGLHASSLWKTCARQRVLAALHKKPKEKLSAGNFLTFDVGHAMHHFWQNHYLGPMGILWGEWFCSRCGDVTSTGFQPVECPRCHQPRKVVLTYAEQRVHDPVLGYVGHCDGVLVLGSWRRVFEFKTASQSEYESLVRPKSQHVVQAHAYMSCLRLSGAVIVYQNKGRQCAWTKNSDGWHAGKPEIKVFHIPFDPEYWTTYVKRCGEYHKAEKLVRSLPVVAADHARQFERLCAHKRAPLAEECDYVHECFAL